MRILVVEDERKIANAIKKGLEQESFAVDVAYDGEEGEASATVDEYDLVIMDRMLPGGKDGVEIVREIRKAKKRMPILLLTAKDKVRDRVEGLDAGADDYLVKPFAFEELLARVRALLRRPDDALGTVLTFEDLTLDPAKFEVTRGGRPVQLTHKEFALLEYLLRNPNRILSKDAITQHVWDYDADILPNTVEVYIGYLRNKIDKPFKGKALIHTIRGFGYKLAA
ncbi:MAG TPA: response regulator transcription factor [Candidatus Saccharimonadales bacterium]|nr:response regulator transcription factor [Candidatus Saccharimonadales bacterium]